MAHAHAFPFHHILAGGGGVEEEIHQMIFEKIHLVDIQKAAMGAREQSGLDRSAVKHY